MGEQPDISNAEWQVMNAVWDGSGVYWHFVFGLLLVLVVLFVRGGISGLLKGRAHA